jgi:NADPH:quinone reductase-like Zn-dependent oxidoreductase
VRAVVRDRFGLPEVLRVEEVERPSVGEHDVLVRVRAVSVNPLDWHVVTGVPYVARLEAGWRRPKSPRIGTDFAGVVEAVGAAVREFRAGDEVFGARPGSFAEYQLVPEGRAIVAKPANVTFEEAAAVPVAAVTALQALREKGRVERGMRVLVNGASGGVGTFAVQIAKADGADVTAVCSTRNVEQARALGADTVIDYTREDFTRDGARYDVILDNVGSRSWRDYRRALTARGRLVVVGGPKRGRVLGPMSNLVRLEIASLATRASVVSLFATVDKQRLLVLRELLETHAVVPAVERTYALDEIAEALHYVGAGHARGKVVVTL